MPASPISSDRPLILIDEAVEGDRRVARSVSAFPGAEIVDIRRSSGPGFWSRASCLLATVGLIAAALCSAPISRSRRIAPLLPERVRYGLATGLASGFSWTYRAVAAAQALRRAHRQFTVIHAHDLYCGLCAVLAAASRDCHLVYNAHEFEIHRNRRAGWLRILAEHHLERRVVESAEEIVVVNRAIAEAMQALYTIPASRFRIEYNDFYPHHPVPHPDVGPRPAIVYVGKGVHGRQLERLDRPEDELGFSIHGYFLGRVLPAHLSGRSWRLGPVDYEADLAALARSRRCLMWCCLDAHVLSYKLALPNKFFQALAIGIPIIASPGTYLAELVDRHGLGVTLAEAGEFAQLARRVQSPEFEDWVAAVAAFRDEFRRGEIVI
jgi:glycosyltransferase involved in cell wall biosynthesis